MKIFRIFLLNVILVFILLAIIEGISSYIIVIRNNLKTQPLAERLHTQYDPIIGWVNIPNIMIPNLYGPNISFKTNSQGYRSDKDFSSNIPHKKKRIICSGDSFTQGYGVSNPDTWAEQLTKIDTSLETINLGQGGYGIDQSYLLFLREKDQIQYNVHIFSFITADFIRMQSNKFIGYRKPMFTLEGDSLKLTGVPVPKKSYKFYKVFNQIKGLRTVSLLTLIKQKFFLTTNVNQKPSSPQTIEQSKTILYKIFHNLKKETITNQSQLILVYLPTMLALKDRDAKDWASYIDDISSSLDIKFINFIEICENLSNEEIEQMFIQKSEDVYYDAAGHLSKFGNQFVAKSLYKEINGILKSN